MNVMIKFTQLGGLLGDIFGALGNVFNNIMSALFLNISMFLYTIAILPLYLIGDGVLILFKKFAGLDTYIYNGESRSGDIVLSLINDKTVQDVFWALLILAVVLLIITTIIAIVKSETVKNEERSKVTKSKIFAKSVRALVNFFMVPAIALLGIFMGNALLDALNKATSVGGDEFTVSGAVFKATAYDCNRARTNATFASDLKEGYNSFGVIEANKVEDIADVVDTAFLKNTPIPENNQKPLDNEKFGSLFSSGGTYLFMIGVHMYLPGLAFKTIKSFNVYDVTTVAYYYNLVDFNFLIAIISLCFIAYVLVVSAVGLIKRLFKITIYLCIAPPIIALGPIDDGAALTKWKKDFIGSVLMAYGTVVALNLTIMLLGPLQNIDLFAFNSGALNVIAAPLLNSLAHLLIICAGFLYFKDFSSGLSALIGGEDAFGTGAKATGELAKKVGKAAAIATGVGGAALKAGKSIQMKKQMDMAKKNAEGLGSQMADMLKDKNGNELKGAARDKVMNSKDYKDLEKQKQDVEGIANSLEQDRKSYSAQAKKRLNDVRKDFNSLASGGISDEFSKAYGTHEKENKVLKNRRKLGNLALKAGKGNKFSSWRLKRKGFADPGLKLTNEIDGASQQTLIDKENASKTSEEYSNYREQLKKVNKQIKGFEKTHKDDDAFGHLSESDVERRDYLMGEQKRLQELVNTKRLDSKYKENLYRVSKDKEKDLIKQQELLHRQDYLNTVNGKGANSSGSGSGSGHGGSGSGHGGSGHGGKTGLTEKDKTDLAKEIVKEFNKQQSKKEKTNPTTPSRKK